MDLTPTIYCTKTNRIIDTCLPGKEGPEAKLPRLAKEYGSDLLVLTFDEAYRRNETAAKTKPVEIDDKEFEYGLNVLPPVGWRNDGASESFKISECLTSAVTAIYVRIGERKFSCNDDIRMPHEACCERFSALKPTSTWPSPMTTWRI